MSAASAQPPAWPQRIHAVLKDADVRQIAYVPDAGHGALIRLCHADAEVATVPLTTEEEGVAMLAGAWLGGRHGALLMQSSGVGNCINMLSLQQECRIPLLALVTMRGDFGEGNPQQIPMGRAVPGVLEACGVIVLRADRPDDVEPTVRAACTMAFEGCRAVAVLLGQRLIGAKVMKAKR